MPIGGELQAVVLGRALSAPTSQLDQSNGNATLQVSCVTVDENQHVGALFGWVKNGLKTERLKGGHHGFRRVQNTDGVLKPEFLNDVLHALQYRFVYKVAGEDTGHREGIYVLRLNKRQQVGIDGGCFGRRHAVRKAGVGDQLTVL